MRTTLCFMMINATMINMCSKFFWNPLMHGTERHDDKHVFKVVLDRTPWW